MSCNVIDWDARVLYAEFQSLSGFPMSCNFTALVEVGAELGGFNPYRVFQ